MMNGYVTPMVRRLAVQGLAVALLLPAGLPLAWAVRYDTPNPGSSISEDSMMQMMNVNALAQQQLQLQALGNIGKMDFGQMLAGALVGFAASKLNLNPALTGMLAGGVASMMQGKDIGSSIESALKSSFLTGGGGIQGGNFAGSGSFGAFEMGALAVSQALSGGGSSSGFGSSGSSSSSNWYDEPVNAPIKVESTETVNRADGGSTTMTTYSDGSVKVTETQGTGTVVASNTPSLNANASVDTTSVNYISGQYDGMNCQAMDARFITGKDANGEDVYDSNYKQGYDSTHKSCSA